MTTETLELQVGVSERLDLDSRPSPALPKHVARTLVGGTSALGLSVVLERGLGFLANLLAARLGGASTFGAYSLAITTATNVSTYAAGGIGSTAVRFAGKYPRESSQYKRLTEALSIISLVSALVAAIGLWLGAKPIAHLLGNERLAGLLSWAALSAAGIILLECCRGFLVGQRRLPALVLLSVTVGVGMVCVLPIVSRWGAVSMVCAQGFITIGAVAVCIAFFRSLGSQPVQITAHGESLLPMLREVWSFGLVQLAGLVGMNAAGWWLASLVARSDTSMVQMGFFAIASQLRNIVALAPTLLTESSLAVMAQREGDVEKTPDHVMAICTFATMFGSLLIAGLAAVVAPWLIVAMYGKSYAAAGAAVCVALAVAVVHMGSGPAAARLSIVSIKTTGLVNTVWAVLVAISATMFLFHGGNAWKGMLIILFAHIVSALLVFATLNSRDCIPKGLVLVYTLGLAGSVGIAGLSLARFAYPAYAASIGAFLLFFSAGILLILFAVGRRHSWVPRLSTVVSFLRLRGAFRNSSSAVLEDRGCNG